MARFPLGGDAFTHDRLNERRTDDAWLERAWSSSGSRVLVLAGSRVLAPGGQLRWVPATEAPADGVRLVLGSPQSTGPVSLAVILPAEAATGEDWRSLRSLLTGLTGAGDDDAAYLVHAVGIAEWLRATKHCPRCGGRLEATHAGHVLRCPDCGREQFPRSDPAVIMLVTDDAERALLGHQSVWPEGRWSTLAGFVEPGESLEAAVRREVHEETGVRVGEATYFGSQPWPLPASLMLGFHARAEEDEAATAIAVDGEEIQAARWFTREEVLAGATDGSLQLPSGISISRALIESWYGGSLPGEWH